METITDDDSADGNQVNGVEVVEVDSTDADNADDDDDDIVVEGEVTRSAVELNEIISQKADEFIAWFSRLPPSYLSDVEFLSDPDYVTTAVRATVCVDMGIARGIFEEFKRLGDCEAVNALYDDMHADVVVVAIILAALDEKNASDIDWTLMCEGRIEKLAVSKMQAFLLRHGVGTQPDSLKGPSEMISAMYLMPTDALLTLAILSMEVKGWKYTVNWDRLRTQTIMFTPNTIECTSDSIYSMALADMDKLRDSRPDVVAKNACEPANAEINKSTALITTRISETHEYVLAMHSTKIGRLCQKYREAVEIPEKEECFSDDFHEEIRARYDRAVRAQQVFEDRKVELTAELTAWNTGRLPPRVHPPAAIAPVGSLLSILVPRIGELVLARHDPNDSQDFELGRVCAERKLDGLFTKTTQYEVKFLSSQLSERTVTNDIAILRLCMIDAVVANTEYLGLRVACLVPGDRRSETRWLSGTLSGRPSTTHGYEFLVFLDNGTDIYIKAPSKLNSPDYLDSLEYDVLSTHTNDQLQRMKLLKMFPLARQPLDAEGCIVRQLVPEMLRDKERKIFIKAYLTQFPDWPLLRLKRASPCSPHVPISVYDPTRKKIRSSVVLETDRALARIRYCEPQSSLGYDCYDYPCTRHHHMHEDEVIYRGSMRLQKIMMGQSEDSNLSQRARNRCRTQFDCAEPELSLPTQVNFNEKLEKGKGGRPRKFPTARVNLSIEAREEIEKRRVKERVMKITHMKAPPMQTLKKLLPHDECGPECLLGIDGGPYDKRFIRCSPLHVPIACGWRRHIYRYKFAKNRRGRRADSFVRYRAPCGNPMSDMADIAAYLRITQSALSIDCFTFDLDIDTERIVVIDPRYLVMPDYSQGIEAVLLPVVNTIDMEKPPEITYSNRRQRFDETVDLSTIGSGFCSGCSCEGDCSDPTTCECQMLSATSYEALPKSLRELGKRRRFPYENRVIGGKIYSGVYECNEFCACNRTTCFNRVIQNPIKYPIQIYKTAESGWGVRAMTDIPRGAFICNYVGNLLTNDLADGMQNDDQYFADLDLKDTVEKEKIFEDTQTDFGFESDDSHGDGEDEDAYSSGRSSSHGQPANVVVDDDADDDDIGGGDDDGDESYEDDSAFDASSTQRSRRTGRRLRRRRRHFDDVDAGEGDVQKKATTKRKVVVSDEDGLLEGQDTSMVESKVTLDKPANVADDDDDIEEIRGDAFDDASTPEPAAKSFVSEKAARKSRQQSVVEPSSEPAVCHFKWDTYFGNNALFVVDAKTRGNVGRFLNHSCDPNVFVQHVLYDTHDLRLPFVSFFAAKNIVAGEALCWNYNYDLSDRDEEDQVPCRCGAENCRKRLL